MGVNVNNQQSDNACVWEVTLEVGVNIRVCRVSRGVTIHLPK